MSVVDLKNSDSSDSDIFVIKQIKPVNKITLPEALIIKYGVLNSFNSKKKKKKKKDQFKKCITDSDIKKSKERKNHSVIAGKDLQKKLNKSNSNKNSMQTSCSSGEFGGNCSSKFISNWIKESTSNDGEKKIKSEKKEKKGGTSCKVLSNTQELDNISVSAFSNGFENKHLENLLLSPGTSRKRKRIATNNTTLKVESPKKKIKKPLMKLFNMMENDNPVVRKEPENGGTVSAEMEAKCKPSLTVGSENNAAKESIKLNDYSDINEVDFIESEFPEKCFSYDEFHNKLANSLNLAVENDVEKFSNNSELLCFLLKKIIRDETKNQINLEKESLRSGKIIEKLFSESECRILEKFFYLEDSACKVFVRMLGRTKNWHRISTIKYEDIGENLETEFQILHKENFVDTNIEEEDLKTQLYLLSKPEILKLCRAFNVFLKSSSSCKKEDLINSLIEDGKRQISVLDMFKGKKQASRVNLMKAEVKNILGLCIRIKKCIFQVFHKILVLFSFSFYYNEEDKRFSNVLFLCYQVYKNMIKFPNYKLSPTVVFETRADFEQYEKSLLLQDSFEIAISNKNYDEFVFVFNKAKDEFKKLLKNQNYQHRFLSLQPFLRKFSAGTVYARILTNYCKQFKRKTDILEVISTVQLLIEQNLFLVGKKGEWYEILSKALEIQKQNNAAAELLIKSVKDPLINEVQKLNLQLRGLKILKKKTCGINDSFIREMLDDVCTPSVQEPASVEIRGKVLDGNESGFKSIYVQDFQHGKMFTSVEERAISYYKSNGFTKGCHAEGYIVQTIYFILFYDIIYKLSPEGVFLSSFQEAPLDIYSSSFYLNRKEDIDLLLSKMVNWDDNQIEAKIREGYYKNYSINCVIKWNDEFTPELFCEVIRCITMPALVLIFQRFIKNFRVVRSGFPDLTLWNPGSNKCKFVEVKSPNDKLSPAQRVWLDFLRNIGLDCEVCNVKNVSSKSIR